MSRARTGSAVLWLVWSLLAIGCRDVRAPAADPAGGDEGLAPNLVVVVLDAARADHVGVYGYDRDTTPRIDAFAASATRYDRVLSEASYTFLSTSSLFAAAGPAVTGFGARRGGRVPAEAELLAEVARAHGYATVAYSENPYVTGYFGLDQGFDRFREAWPTSALRDGLAPVADFESEAAIRGAVAEATRDPERPFLLYLHLLRPHNPYAPPPPFAGRFGSDPAQRVLGATEPLLALDRAGPPFDPEQIEQITALYDENLAYADALFGGLLDELEARGVSDDTVVVLTSDHGEAFGEHGRLLHATQLYDPMLRVPLVVRVPGVAPGVDPTPIQLADLGRGLRAVAGGAAPARLAALGAGRDRNEPLYSFTNAATGRIAAWLPDRRLILDMRTLEPVAYYDLARDPESRTPIVLDPRGVALRDALRAQVRRWTGPRTAVAAPALDPAKRAQLRALGYVEP